MDKLSEEQEEIDKRIKFVLDNKWIQKIIFTINKMCEDLGRLYNCNNNNFNTNYGKSDKWITTFVQKFKQISGRWHISDSDITNIPILLENKKMISVSKHSYYELYIIDLIYKLHFRLDDDFLNIGTYKLLVIYNYFKQ